MSAATHPKLNPLDPFENCPMVPARELLARRGYTPPPPHAVSDAELAGRLWEFIYAMAALRCFLTRTDHVEDRALYRWLHDEWLEEPMADIPLSFGWCTHIEVPDELATASSDDEGKDDDEDDEPLDMWEPPAVCERDDWLPQPPGTPSGPPPPEDEQDLNEFERERLALAADPSPDDLPEGDGSERLVTARLWERLHNLSCRGAYFENTDHLSDRELYRELWRHGFREGPLPPEGRSNDWGWVYDIANNEGPEPSETWLAYYASDEERQGYALMYPDRPLPERRERVDRRDWRLPQVQGRRPL